MNPRDRAELEAVLEYAKKVRDDPKTDRTWAKMLDNWIRRDEEALSGDKPIEQYDWSLFR